MKSIAIITGGRDKESEVSIRSAINVAKALEGVYKVDVFNFPDDLGDFIKQSDQYLITIPVIHGKGGEDGEITKILGELKIKYLFSDSQDHINAFDKDKAKKIVELVGITVPNGLKIKKGDLVNFPLPYVVKPLDSGSSLGVSVVKSSEEMDIALQKAFETSESVLIEEYIEGDEYTVGVIEFDSKNISLPVVGIKPKINFFDFESKYNANVLADESCPALIDNSLALKLQDVALKAHEALNMRHISRTDLIVNKEGEIYFLEINSIPGMTDTSLIPKELAVINKTLKDVFLNWIMRSC